MAQTTSQTQSTIIQIVLAIIASSLIVTLFNTVYSDLFKKPYLTTDFVELAVYDNGSSHYLMNIYNQGLEPAKNLTLTITSPYYTMLNMSYFATENVTLVSNLPDYKQFKAKRFAHGKGDLLQVDTTFAKTPQDIKNEVFVYSTYDQGSNASSEPIDALHQFLFAVTSGNNYLAIAIISSLAAYLIFLLVLIKRRQVRRQSEFTLRLKGNIMGIRDRLRDPYHSEKKLFKRLRLVPWYAFYYRRAKVQIFSDINVYDMIDNFYEKIWEREDLVSKEEYDHNELKRLNEECLKLSDDLLKRINWSEYIPSLIKAG